MHTYLKSICFIFLSIFLIGSTNAQILNAGFEDWSVSSLIGISYDSLDNYDSPARLAVALELTDTFVYQGPATFSDPTAFEGSSYVKMVSKLVNIAGLITTTIPGSVGTGNYFINLFALEFGLIEKGIPYTNRPTAISGMYQYIPVGIDTFYAYAKLKRAGVVIGEGEYFTTSTVSSWTAFDINISYSSTLDPDTLILFFGASKLGGLGGLPGSDGSLAYVDALTDGTTMLSCDPSFAPTGTSAMPDPTGVTFNWDPLLSPACKIAGRRAGGGGATKEIIVPIPGASSFFIPSSIFSPSTGYSWNIQCACDLSPLTLTPWSDTLFFVSSMRLGQFNNEIKISPNPSNGMIWLKGLNEIDDVKVQLFSAEGKLIEEIENHNPSAPIVLPEYEGLIFLDLPEVEGFEPISVVQLK